MDWAIGQALPHETQLARVQHLQLLMRDVIAQLPASSIDVERSHANVQVDVAANKIVPKRPSNVQADAYICGVSLVHEKLKKQVESESFGQAAMRVKRTLRARRVESGAPGQGLSVKRANFNDDGTVRRRNGLLKGLLSPVRFLVGYSLAVAPIAYSL